MVALKSSIGTGRRLFRADSSFSSRSLFAAALAAAGSMAFSAVGASVAQPARGDGAAPSGPVWLEQGWTERERREFHHRSQGTLTLPIPATWFVALERPTIRRTGMFNDPDYIETFGFIPAAADPITNPMGLPVGFARTVGTDPGSGSAIDGLGFTCAACHTGRIDHGGATMLIDGGAAMINLDGFGAKLGYALGLTLSPPRFSRFADRVVGPNRAARLRLWRQLDRVVKRGLGQVVQGLRVRGSVDEGFGRLDAINRIGNQVFGEGMGIRSNVVPRTAPVAYPHIWGTSWFDWVQYNGSIEQPMVRNAGEAMGVGAAVNYRGGTTPRFTSTIPVGVLHADIEQILAGTTPPLPAGRFSGLRAPAWPEHILSEIEPELAQRGAELYQERCQGCHLPATGTAEFWQDRYWTAANAAGERYLRLKLIPISVIGTDPAQATGMRSRIVTVPAELGLVRELSRNGAMRTYPFGDALGQVVEKVVDRWYDSQVPPTLPADRDRMNGYRPNGIRAELAYKARPLDGIWATAPYLHNGSVLTLWELLSPYEERRSRFHLGTHDFDAVRVGYIDGGPFLLNTAIAGNRNTGHLFETPSDPSRPRPGIIGPGLSVSDRRALVEYLKTL